jgi:hypothetical protein
MRIDANAAKIGLRQRGSAENDRTHELRFQPA